MESYKTSWYSEEPLDLSMKVTARPKKSQQSNDSPLCMVKSCACALSINDKQNESTLSDTNMDDSSSDASFKGRDSEYSVDDKSGMTTNESVQGVYSKKSLTPPSPYRRDGRLGLDSRSPLGESPPQAGRSTPQHYRHECSSSPSPSSSRSPFPPPSAYQSFKGGKYDGKQSAKSATEWEYSEIQYDRESSVRDVPYYRNMPSPQDVKHELESPSFADRGTGKNYRSGRADEKTTFVCMDTGKYYESMSMWYRGSSSNTKRVSSPQDKSPNSQSPNSEIRASLDNNESKHPEEHILYSSRGSVVYGERSSPGGHIHIDRHASERQTMSNAAKYSTDVDAKDPTHLKQKENALWSPASGVCYKQYQTSLKRQFVPSGSEYDTDEGEGAKRFSDQSDKSGCQNWLVGESSRSTIKQNRYDKTQTSLKNSGDWIPKFDIVPLTAATETKLTWSHGSSPFIVSKSSISGMESGSEGQNEGDSSKDSDGKDSQVTGEHTNRKMCALDYLISKVLVERIDVPFKACNTEIKRIYRGECKGRLRLVDLIELQVEASLKV